MKTYNIHAAKTHLSRLVEAAAAGEEIVIAKAGKPMAKIVPYVARTQPRPLGLGVGKGYWEAPDAWDPDPDLEAQFYGETDVPRPQVRRVAERRRKPR
jgi:prevent-host-death family protein